MHYNLCNNYPEKLHCIICNSDMRKNFRIGLLGADIITIKNPAHDGVVFVNHFFRRMAWKKARNKDLYRTS